MKINFKRLIFFLLIIVLAIAAIRYCVVNKKAEESPENSAAPTTVAEIATEEPTVNPVDEMMADMTLREKIYQMFIVTPEALAGKSPVQSATAELKRGIENYPVGGIILFADNIVSKKQVKQMISDCSKSDKIPMFFAVDQEGGIVARLNENVGFPVFENMYEYKEQGGKKAYENAKTIAENMSELGFNLDFAPVADVWSNKENTVIGKRAYSDDFEEAAELVSNAVKGFSDGGVICTLKHFPGHGATYADTHNSPAYVTKAKEELNKTDILPFKAGIDSGAEMVMVGHLFTEKIDAKNPATISKAIITDYLKGEIGYSGIVITDALNMGAVTGMYSSGPLCVKAVQAGVDILLMPQDLGAAAAGIESAISTGELSEERINESVRKILNLKAKYSMLK